MHNVRALQAARLCIQVVGGTRAKEVKRKSLRGRRSTREDKRDQVDKPLHWVNMQILDHRCTSACLQRDVLIDECPMSGFLCPHPYTHTYINTQTHTLTGLSSARVCKGWTCGPFSLTLVTRFLPWAQQPSTQMVTTPQCYTLSWTPTPTLWPAPLAGGGRLHQC